MNAAVEKIERLRPRLLSAAIAAAGVAIAMGFVAPNAWAGVYRFAVFACFAPAIGSMLFALIHELTGGEWGRALRPFLGAGLRRSSLALVLAFLAN